MAQHRKIEDDVLLDRLTATFKDVGYEGASLSLLSEATGLKKSSLYHRFPDGKAQMALEVMAETARVLDAEVFPLLADDGTPERKLSAFVRVMDGFYVGGRQSCLLNMLAPPRGEGNACGEAIGATFQRLLAALGAVARQAGATPAQARTRAEQALIELQGSLVVARGMNDPAIFSRALKRIPGVILGA
jgi:TetR/AcrR family transcriptional repressor of lmrAB and yxaGH operons